MRLWHYKLLPYLPRLQLQSQWRELNSIYKKQDKHILINYIYDYSKEYLLVYSLQVIKELRNRGINVKTMDNFNSYFYEYKSTFIDKSFPEHNDRYLLQCYYNLQEKYDRGQAEFTKEQFDKLTIFVQKELGVMNL